MLLFGLTDAVYTLLHTSSSAMCVSAKDGYKISTLQ